MEGERWDGVGGGRRGRGGVGMKKWGEVEKKTAGRKGMVEILARCNGVLKIDVST